MAHNRIRISFAFFSLVLRSLFPQKSFLARKQFSSQKTRKDDVPRETIERGGPCWLVETEVNGDSQRVQMKGVLPWLVRWTCRAGTRDLCSALAALQIFFPHRTLFKFFVLIGHQRWGRQPRWVAYLLVCVSGCSQVSLTAVWYCVSKCGPKQFGW